MVVKLAVDSGCAAENALGDCTSANVAAIVSWVLVLVLVAAWVCAGARQSHLELWAAVLR